MAEITLRAARLQQLLSLEQVTEQIGITVEKLKGYELDAGQATVDEALRLAALYAVSIGHIHWGPENTFKGCQLNALRSVADEIRKDCCVKCWSDVDVKGLYDYKTHDHHFQIVCTSCSNVETLTLHQM